MSGVAVSAPAVSGIAVPAGVHDKVALVTGSSRGIGRATAQLFAREGARVAVTYRTSREAAEHIAAGICDDGGDALAVPLDLTSFDSIRDAADAVLTRWGRVDILVNNAVSWGLRPPTRALEFERLSPAEWREGLRVNIEGTYAITQAVVPSMRQRHWGRIVTVSSAAAVEGLIGSAWYAAAKSAMHGFTRTLAKELGPDGVLANVVMPGLTTSEQVVANVPAVRREEVARATPIGRLLAPEDIAPVVVFLCSAANTGVTGEIIKVSGGA
jgi:3-oxoacyl-[acyl-carrier protein] reductase